MSMSNSRGSFLGSIPTVTKNLIIINILLWVVTFVFKGKGIDLNDYLGLHFWRASDFSIYQLVTYMFMHDTSSVSAGISHIFFNMFSLWMFGATLERAMGYKKYLSYYLVCGIGAGVIQELAWHFDVFNSVVSELTHAYSISQPEAVEALVNNQVSGFSLNMLITVGASGAVFGILLAFGWLFPNVKMYIIPFPFPIKAKWMVIGYGALELIFGVTGTMSSVAHFAHLGGMLFGFLLLLYWKKTGQISKGGYGYF